MGAFIHLVLSVLKIRYNYNIPIQINLYESIITNYIMNIKYNCGVEDNTNRNQLIILLFKYRSFLTKTKD